MGWHCAVHLPLEADLLKACPNQQTLTGPLGIRLPFCSTTKRVASRGEQTFSLRAVDCGCGDNERLAWMFWAGGWMAAGTSRRTLGSFAFGRYLDNPQ